MRETPLKPLDTATFLDDGSLWRGSFFPGAGELSGSVRLIGLRPSAEICIRTLGARPLLRERPGASGASGASAGSPVRRYAGTPVRRYAVSNRLSGFVTLTFATAPLPDDAMHAVKLTFRRCRENSGSFPFVWTLERGGLRGRIHAHALLSPSHAELLDSHWRERRTDIRDVGEDFESLRSGAGYLTDSFSEGPVAGSRLYSVGNGFAPEMVSIGADSASQLVAEAAHRMGAAPVDELRGALALSAKWSS
jgi:hypothetical protein